MSRPLSKRARLLLKWGGLSVLLTGAVVAAFVIIERRPDPAQVGEDGKVEGLTSVLHRALPEGMTRLSFADVTASSGVDFRHFPGRRSSLLPEDMGPGLAFGDVDGDGDDDLFLVDFAAGLREDASTGGRCALYESGGDGTFRDVTEESGAGLRIRGMGAAFGDADGDADLDLYVTAYGENVLLLNDGSGRFGDGTEASGTSDARFSAGCAWGDPDVDGDLDLYVCNYVAFADRDREEREDTRQYGTEIPFTLNPSSYPAAPNALFVNDGQGRFTDAAGEAGVAAEDGRSLGALWFDYDLDGFVDLYVANDVSRNGVYRNRGDGGFDDVGAETLAADYRGAMGLATSDLGHDGDLDLLVTHWIAQENAFFENVRRESDGRRFFADVADSYGLGQISIETVAWSCGFVDFDDDGLDDLWVVNGSTLEVPSDRSRIVPQRMHLFRQAEGEGFFEMGREACAALSEPFVGRGGAASDIDRDGRVDLVIARHGAAPLFLRNTIETDHHYLALRLRQEGGNHRALGARVTVRAGGRAVMTQVGADGAYLSQHPTDLHFGLGAAETADVEVRWPDGTTETFEGVVVDQLLVLRHAAQY